MLHLYTNTVGNNCTSFQSSQIRTANTNKLRNSVLNRLKKELITNLSNFHHLVKLYGEYWVFFRVGRENSFYVLQAK